MPFKFFQVFSQNKIGVGLDISDRSIKILSLKQKPRGHIQAAAFGYAALEEGVVENGNVLDAAKLSNILKEALANTQPVPLQKKEVIVALPESKVFIDTYKVHNRIKGNKLQEELRRLAAAHIPFEPEALYADFRFLSTDAKKQENEYLYIASPKDVVDKYIESFRNAGVAPLAFDIESASLRRALVGSDDSLEAILLVDIGARTTNLSISFKGEIRLSAVLPFGGNHLTEAIAQHFKLSFSEAERLKVSLGLDNKIDGNQLPALLESIYKPAFEKIKIQLDYYKRINQQQVKKAILCGGSSLVRGIKECLMKTLGIEVSFVDPWKKQGILVDSEAGKVFLKKEAPILYATVIGLALRGINNDPRNSGINLLNFKGHKN